MSYLSLLSDISPLGGWEWVANLTATALIALLFGWYRVVRLPKIDEDHRAERAETSLLHKKEREDLLKEHREERKAYDERSSTVVEQFIQELRTERDQAARERAETGRAIQTLASSATDALSSAHAQMKELALRVEQLSKSGRNDV